jgi:5-formyltetrahydrofolate cyclo-ligase
MTEPISDLKRALRKRIRALRDAASPEQRAAWSAAITAQAIAHPAYQRAHAIFVFLSFQSEVDTNAIVRDALARGKRVCVPDFAAPDAPMSLTELTAQDLETDAFDHGLWGTRTPKTRRPVPVDAIDLVFAPLLVFARTPAGIARMGYGKGHYDAFLPRLRTGVPVIGLAFELQAVASLPVEAHDVLLGEVISPHARYISFQ